MRNLKLLGFVVVSLWLAYQTSYYSEELTIVYTIDNATELGAVDR